MKIIINESQLRLIVENEGGGKLLTLPAEFLDKEKGFEKAYNLYTKNKGNKNYNGIKLIGEFNLDYFDYFSDEDSEIVNEFFDEVVEIDGDLYSGEYGDLSKLSKLRYVSGSLEIPSTNVMELPNLIKVGGNLSLAGTFIKTLPLLEKVDGEFFLTNSSIIGIPNLVSVGRGMYGDRSQIKYLPKLESVGADNDHDLYKDDLTLWRTNITELPSLKYVNGNLSLGDSPLGKELDASGMTNAEINDKFGVQGKLYIWN